MGMIEAIIEHSGDGVKDLAKTTFDRIEERGWVKGLEKGREEGDVKSRALLVRQLELRFGTLPLLAKARVLAAAPQQVETWALRMPTAGSLDEALGDH